MTSVAVLTARRIPRAKVAIRQPMAATIAEPSRLAITGEEAGQSRQALPAVVAAAAAAAAAVAVGAATTANNW